MKFGENMKRHMVSGWYYINYDALKMLLKKHTTHESTASLLTLETEFLALIKSEIQAVNKFFLEKEHSIDALKSRISKGTLSTDDRNGLRTMLTTLCRWVVLNYLAVLKICKKYQKYGGSKEATNRVATIVKSDLFKAPFFLCLKDSSLFASVGGLLKKLHGNGGREWYDVRCPLCLEVMTSGNASLSCGYVFTHITPKGCTTTFAHFKYIYISQQKHIYCHTNNNIQRTGIISVGNVSHSVLGTT